MHLRHRSKAQAVVEFALAATLIFFMLSAVVDLGLVFFALQGQNSAAQEGANYGSSAGVVSKDAGGGIQIGVLDINGIKDRVRKESGTRGGIGFVNLLDLNNNGTADVTCPSGEPVIGCSGGTYDNDSGNRVVDSYIRVRAVADTSYTGQVTTSSPDCSDIYRSTVPCYVLVEVDYQYKPVFPLAPVFGDSVKITSRYFLGIRSSASSGDPNAQPTVTSQCTVPNLVGLTRSQAASAYSGAGFTGSITPTGPSASSKVKSQQLSAGSTRDCSTNMSVTWQ